MSKRLYFEKVQTRKEVTLPSGFKIVMRKLTGHDFIREASIPISSIRDIASTTSKEKSQIIWDRMTDEQKAAQIAANDRMIVAAVVEPKISLASTDDDTLSVRDLSDEDYFAILQELSTFSTGRQDLKPFRDGESTVDAGCSSETVRSQTVVSDFDANRVTTA